MDTARISGFETGRHRALCGTDVAEVVDLFGLFGVRSCRF